MAGSESHKPDCWGQGGENYHRRVLDCQCLLQLKENLSKSLDWRPSLTHVLREKEINWGSIRVRCYYNASQASHMLRTPRLKAELSLKGGLDSIRQIKRSSHAKGNRSLRIQFQDIGFKAGDDCKWPKRLSYDRKRNWNWNRSRHECLCYVPNLMRILSRKKQITRGRHDIIGLN